MRNKIMIIAVLLAVMAAMTGIASADTPPIGYTCKDGNVNGMGYGECLKASWDNINTKIDASSANTEHTNNVCYQVRYYPPGKFVENNLYIDEDGIDNTGRVGPFPSDPAGFYTGVLFTGNQDPHSESLNNVPDGPVESWTQGDWMVALMHRGKSANANCADLTGLANSLKVSVPVNIPIPEFSTVAIPIAAVLGLVFFFQQTKKKEE